jgi:membrane protease YdiL (CAAX protease family)
LKGSGEGPVNGCSPATWSFVDWLKLLAGFAVVFALIQYVGGVLGSDRGQAGILIGLLVIAALAAAECLLFRKRVPSSLRALGLGPPDRRGMAAAAVVGLLLLALLPVITRASGAPLALRPEWPWLLVGLFAQAGIAEEALFRGYLFRHLHEGRPFWRAASLSMLPFVAVHLPFFLWFSWPVALASILLSAAISFPLAHLFVLAGSTIWPPALVHFIVQGAIKLIVIPDDMLLLPVAWIVASALVPYSAFAFRRTG